MRGFREIRETREDKEIRDDSLPYANENGFRDIKPETSIAVEEARAFIDRLFTEMEQG